MAREEALRRLGGRDLEAERMEKAMNGDQKLYAMFWTWVAVVVVASIVALYNYEVRRLATQPQVDADCIRACLSAGGHP